MRVAKFDVLYPPQYLKQRQKENISAIGEMDFDQYLEWLHSLKMGLYNVFGREWKKAGWEVFEYYQQDDIFRKKLSEKLCFNLNWRFFLLPQNVHLWWDTELRFLYRALWRKRLREELFKRILLKKYLEYIDPQIIFLREPCQIDNLFWKPYKEKCLIATMIGCNISHPVNWLPHTSDVIFTLTPEYVEFFKLNRIETHLIEYGLDAISDQEKLNKPIKYDITFIGKLGSRDQQRKTETMEAIAGQFDFKWWGPKGEIIDQYPHLQSAWQGYTGGNQMLTIYAESRIVVNDYVHSNGEYSVNMRMKEVMGMGTLLLTREARNISKWVDNDRLVTFREIEDCLRQISYYLEHSEKCEAIAGRGLEYVRERYNYGVILKKVRTILDGKYREKFPCYTSG